MGKRKRGRTLDQFRAILSKGTFDKNIARVNALAKIYDPLPATAKRRHSGAGADVLRAGLVLLHASLEELLRQIARHRIPYGQETALKRIPLVGSDSREKFTLSELARLRGKSVDDVLVESVRQYYDSHATFSSVRAVKAEVLERSNIKQDRVKALYPALEELISRRHDIVHRADMLRPAPRADKALDLSHRAQPLSVEKIRRWTSVVRRFGHGILVEMSQVPLADPSAHVDYLFHDGPPPKRY